MKPINPIPILLLSLAACAPVQPTATPTRAITATVTAATTLPTSTPAPSSTPTVAPTIPPTPAPTQQVKTINTRPGVTMRLLISTPGGSPKAMLLMFPGGDGTNHFSEGAGQITLGLNFLVRTTPLFINSGSASAVVDAPSDRSSGMNGAFRSSPAHAEDIQAAIDFLGNQGFESIYLVGTSAGTISAGYLATVIKDQRMKGLVLTTSLASFFAGFLSNLSLDKITVPVLMVHHREDLCQESRFQDALELRRRFSKVDFEVRGGNTPRSGPCDARSYHGYFGVEEPVVQIISDWISGKTVPPLIGQ